MTNLLWRLILITIWFAGLYEAFQIVVVERQPPILITSEAVLTPSVPQDGGLVVHLSLTRLRPCSQEILQVIYDGKGERFNLPTLLLPNTMELGPSIVDRTIHIPLFASAGLSRFETTTTYYCHWSHSIWPLNSRQYSVSFKITPTAPK